MNAPMEVGALVDGKYQVIESLGQGGMANVWLARDERLGKLWAIKEIKPNVGGAKGEALRQALIDEANFMKRLDHPSIPRIVDIVDDGRTVFVVMDYVDGRSLGELLRLRSRPFDQDQVIGWGVQLCDVLAYLHSRIPPIIYRDMKPGNVIVREDGSVRLIDFGIAVELEDGTDDGRVVGTPGYAPPEQLSWNQQDTTTRQTKGQPTHRASVTFDVYALGTTLYSLVTGHCPTRTQSEDGRAGISFAMRPIRMWNASLSEGLERVILRATHDDPDLRYRTIAEMRYDLAHTEELTQAWREVQQKKIASFHRRVLAASVCTVAAVACLLASRAVRKESYAGLMHAAALASCSADEGMPSEAERLLSSAMSLEPESLDPYERLLDVYVSDYRLTQDETERWQQAFGRARLLEDDPGYARLCFDAGVCHLVYFGIDAQGGAVGNVGIESVGAAAPWFRRAVDSCTKGGGQDLGEADLRSSSIYVTIADFYEQVTRMGKEGRAATSQYREVWHALHEALARENREAEVGKSAEGVRIRLCQVGTEALASPTYLAGFARAGIEREQACGLLEAIRGCWGELGEFVRADEYVEVYGPVAREIEAGLQAAEVNVDAVYGNPVRAWENQSPLEVDS